MAYSLTRREMVPGDWSMGAPLSTTTEDVDVRLSALLTDTNNLNVDVGEWFAKSKGQPGVKSFVDAWVRWRDDTYKFIRSWKEGTFKIKLAWGYYDNAIDRMKELEKWRLQWERLSGKFATAPASKVPDDGSSISKLKPWLIGAGVLVGVGYGVKILSDSGALAAIKHNIAPSGA